MGGLPEGMKGSDMTDRNLVVGLAHCRVSDSADALATAAAARIVMLARESLAHSGRFVLALAGGNTPRQCYAQLRHANLDWLQVHVYFGDERCLPWGHPDRNDVMARAAWLDHVPIPAAHIHSIPAEQGPRQAAQAYAEVIRSALPLDLAVLGVGEDGHTASLFPGDPALASSALVVPVFHAPKPPEERVTLSLGTLNGARHKLFLASGVGKRAILERLGEHPELPAAQVREAQWFVDRAAWPG